MKKRHIILTCALAAMVLSASIGGAWSYFTTYAEAKGGYTISLGDETTVHEDFSNWEKKISISNKEGSQPVYIRVKAFAGDQYKDLLKYSDENNKWFPGEDGYYYYSDPVAANEATDILTISLRDIKEDIPEVDGKHFNVVVIYESTPVLYQEGSGEPVGYENADWSRKVDTGEAGGES